MNAIPRRPTSGRRHLITGPNGSFDSHLALPRSRPAPAIVVIQEIFGINEDMRTTCDRLASSGYMAICPDLYWRMEPNVSLTDKTPEEWDKAMRLLDAFDVEAGVRDLAATINAARQLPGASGAVGVVGYCLGGRLAYLVAARTDANACVSYYGVRIDNHLDEKAKIRNPLLMHVAEQDEFVPAAARQMIAAALRDLRGVEIYTYPGCNHAFARNNGVHYNAAAAELANSRTAAFFRKHLQSFASAAEVQSRLIDLGYYDGPVDGKPSHLAIAALARFQHDHDLPATGELDPVTVQALRETYCY
jgi:carboxymethylenebutenolidase